MKRLIPLRGMDNVSDDEAMSSLGDTPFVYLRDAVNVNILPTGRLELRGTGAIVTSTKYKNLWQSALHGDLFGTLDDVLVKIESDWSHTSLNVLLVGSVSFVLVNNYIVIGDDIHLYKFNGQSLTKLTIDTPPPPMGREVGGSLSKGLYNVAISWSKDGKESALSDTTAFDVEGGIELILPYNYSGDADQVNIYMTSKDGGELLKLITLPIGTNSTTISNDKDLTRSAYFKDLSPMPSGKFLKFWRGRLLTASKNIINFSQALNFHLQDARYDYFAMPQRISFIEPVESGIWVGLTTHVAFLSGTDVNNLQMVNKSGQPPVARSAIRVSSDLVGDIAGGMDCIVWLSANGYCIGTSSGMMIETGANKLKGISANSGQSVRFDDRIVTTLN